MESRHEATLTNRLEAAIDIGYAHLSWGELYRWYDTKKIAAGTYRDLAKRWKEVSGGKLGELKRIECQDGIMILPETYIKPVFIEE